MRILFFAFLVLTFASACNKKIGTATTDNTSTSASTSRKATKMMRTLEDNRFLTEYFEGRAKIKVESKDFNIGGTATIRIERDKAIWVSMKKFGFEGARALIRPDSFFVVNKLNGDYTAEPLSYIEEKYKIPARFDLLQEMMMGNAVFFSRNMELADEDSFLVLTGRDDRFETEHLLDKTDLRLLQTSLTEFGQNRKLQVMNGDFRQAERINGQPDFAHKRTINVDAGAQSGKFEMEFTRLNFSGPLAMPFRKQ